MESVVLAMVHHNPHEKENALNESPGIVEGVEERKGGGRGRYNGVTVQVLWGEPLTDPKPPTTQAAQKLERAKTSIPMRPCSFSQAVCLTLW